MAVMRSIHRLASKCARLRLAPMTAPKLHDVIMMRRSCDAPLAYIQQSRLEPALRQTLEVCGMMQ